MDLLSVNEAAKYLRLSRVTLDKWRGAGKGPSYITVGRYIKYRRDVLDAFLEKNTVKTGDMEKRKKGRRDGWGKQE